MDDAAAFGARLREYRRAAGLTQQELAERSGLSVRTIGYLEQGRARWPHQQSVRRLAGALGLEGLSADKFIGAAARRLAPAAPAGLPGEPVPQSGSLSTAGLLVPRQLPAPAAGFTGRREQLEVMSRLLTGPNGTALVAAVSGIAGAGKTALAVQWGHLAAEHFPDGQLFVNLRGFDPAAPPTPAADALRGFAEALGVPPDRMPQSENGLAGLYRSLVAGKRILVVLDNARDAAQVRPLLPGSLSCRVVVTSRSQLTGLAALDGAVQLTAAVMSQPEARRLLIRRLGTERAAQDLTAVEQIAESCGRLPIALCITAARAAGRPDLPLGQIAGSLAAARGNLDDLVVAGDPEADVRAAFSWSYELLPPASQRTFRLIGLHPGPDLSAGAVASLAGWPQAHAVPALASLTEYSLLSAAPHGRYSQHDLLRAYAAELAAGRDSQGERQLATRRMLDYYLATARAAARLLDGNQLTADMPVAAAGVVPETHSSRAAAINWFRREYAVLVRLIDLAAAAGFDVHAWQLTRALRRPFDNWARWDDWDHAQQVAAASAVRLGDLRAQALIYLSWYRCDAYRTDWPRAEEHLQRALSLFQELGDQPGQARVLISLAVAASDAKRYELATSWAQRALSLYTELGDLDGQAGSLANLGLYRARLGSFAPAMDLLTKAREMFAGLGSRSGEALSCNSLGLAALGLGDYQQAIVSYAAAADIFGELGDPADQAEVLGNLTDAYLGDGQRAQAIAACERALGILTELSHPAADRVQARLASLRAGGH